MRLDSIVFFDFRHFSAHRQYLANMRNALPLTTLVKATLELAVTTAQSYKPSSLRPKPLLNYTGDGFVLVFKHSNACLAALRFASQFRESLSDLLQEYSRAFEELKATDPDSAPKDLDYGIGIHCGPVTEFKYRGFTGATTGFIGSAVNIASRVEGCTKDHRYRVLCTKTVRDEARKQLRQITTPEFDKYFTSIGSHRLRGVDGFFVLINCKPKFHGIIN